VQDAAHRAGFVQSRSHVFSLRNAIRESIGDQALSLDDLVEALMRDAGDDRFRRHRLLAPEIVDTENFRRFWSSETARTVPVHTTRRVRTRLKFDVAMEFGLQSRVGRTLELTGSVAAQVDAGPASLLETVGRAAITGFSTPVGLDDDDSDGQIAADVVVRWVRGAIERMRERGAIEHDWFRKYIENDGDRFSVWGGRPRGQGMPAFPRGRDAPGYPRFGPAALGAKGKRETGLDSGSSAQSWYARWTARNLRVSPSDGAKLTRLLFTELEGADIVHARAVGAGGAQAYSIDPSKIVVGPIALDALKSGAHTLVCDTCQTPVPGTAEVVSQFHHGPCLAARCVGHLQTSTGGTNYYRSMYDDGDMRRVVAREHTSLLDDKMRLAYENGFKESINEPDAPNVLVATPTLEMGIDIGDLSAVFLAGLPRSVASYLQRVGRAGRLTGNSITLAFVLGRGDQLPKLGDPASVINGHVRPPATYLDAEEILQRQYTASLMDQLSSVGKLLDVDDARSVLASTEPDSVLARVIDDAEANASNRLAAFLTTFEGLSEWATDSLRSWATPGEHAWSSGLAATLTTASNVWNAELETLKIRRKTIADSLDDLKAKAAHPAHTDEDVTALRAANASYRMVIRQLKDLRSERWVGALERFGVLPNYTLLDDSVRLDVALSWLDPDTQEFEHDGITYERGAGIAINELAPGAHFYAQGVEIEIDAVDLGNEGAAVQTWVFCPACGFATDLAGSSQASVASACPRCGSKAIADTNQLIDVVELTQVSAEVRRDESTISDRSDERTRERFTVQVAADIDPAKVITQWYVENSYFGVKYLRDMTIRWVNIGKTVASGSALMLAGTEFAASYFRVCEACGKLDQRGHTNSAREHRAWCRHRTAKVEHNRHIALTRTLVTQGIVLRLPPATTIGDSLAIPSISAAIQLGLREVIGGDPDHLRLINVVDPVLSDGGDNITSLLIHDSVPGGTGYLADLADKDRIRDVLIKAYERVLTCECRDEGRHACHRCLLPYAPGGSVDLISRASAERHLRTLIGIDAEGTYLPWDVTDTDLPSGVGEPPLEGWFRKVFMDRARSVGATVKEKPGAWGNTVQVTIPGTNMVWQLKPQISVGFTKPDFVLEPTYGGAIPIAIYTDGRAFHASLAHNRIADDAVKRRALRDEGYLVMALTWDDVKRADEGTPEPTPVWFDKAHAGLFVSALGLSPSSLDHIVANPISQLMEWMQDPGGALARWRKVAETLPTLLTSPKGKWVTTVAESLVDDVASVLDGVELAPSTTGTSWVVTLDDVVLLAARGAHGTDAVLLLDDRGKAVAGTTHADSWRTWLRLSNLLGAHDAHHAPVIGARSESFSVGPVDVTPTPVVAIEWSELLEFADGDERALLLALSEVDGMIVPEQGIELDSGSPIALAWPTAKLAVVFDDDTDHLDELASAGWTVIPTDVVAIQTALSESSN
jgi:hypothetical protein